MRNANRVGFEMAALTRQLNKETIDDLQSVLSCSVSDLSQKRFDYSQVLLLAKDSPLSCKYMAVNAL